MNKTIRKVALFMCCMFAALMINSSVTLFLRHGDLAANPYNQRMRTEDFGKPRGAITLAGGTTVIADSKPSNDTLKQQRFYAEGPMYAPITGYYAYQYGQSQLERSYNKYLSGSSDALAVQRIVDQLTGKPPKGASLELTINQRVQQTAAKALGDQAGAVVAINPQTGAVIALYSNPSWDPNMLATHDLGQLKDNWEQVNANNSTMILNRASSEIYPPGSTFKIVVAAAALEEGIAKPDTLVDAPEKYRLPGTTTDLPNQGTCSGKMPLEQAFKNSCNTTFAILGVQIGQDKLRAQAEKFGFNKDQLPELYGTTSRFPKDLDGAQTAMSSIGQFNVAASPLQMAMVGAAVANNGTVMEPYVVQKVVGPNLETISDRKPKELTRAMKPENARLLQQMMQTTIESGSGTKAQIPGIKTGGKTGTAENAADHPPFAWFVQFGPVEKASVAVAVFVQEPKGSAFDIQHGGYAIAAPIAKKVTEAALRG